MSHSCEDTVIFIIDSIEVRVAKKGMISFFVVVFFLLFFSFSFFFLTEKDIVHFFYVQNRT